MWSCLISGRFSLKSRQREGSKAATQFSRAEVIAKGPEVREDVAYVTAERARLALRRGK